MANIQSIELTNFKGVSETKILIANKASCPVVTLIGLNESGKTTLLEGISHFVSQDSDVSGLFGTVKSAQSFTGLVPVHRNAAFTDKIIIQGRILIDSEDLKHVAKKLRESGQIIDPAKFPKEITVKRIYNFQDSVYTTTNNIWDLVFDATSTKGAKKIRKFNSPNGQNNAWTIAVNAIKDRLPRIAYFPTFLVEIPTKIYLSEHPNETKVNKYYRTVFQDILKSIDENLSLQRHVVDRINTFKETTGENWFSIFFGSLSKGPIDAVFQKISNAVTRAVIGSWHRVFQRQISARSINVEWNIDPENNDLPYASFTISDGESLYKVSDRSLGFRWFFSFLLFTAFKQKSANSTLFLFDEPAANLHAKAQAELLTSFSRIVEGGHQIVYSTHSHHMINPHWLSGAYIVENTALDYDSEDETFNLSSPPTNIIATPYRNFVSQHPGRTSYFQPVIEKLEYVPPDVVGAAPYLITEGITDYYALKHAAQVLNRKVNFSIIPGVGSGASSPLISQLLGRGDRFLVLLDDDNAGKIAKGSYQSTWFLTDKEVTTLGAIGSEFGGAKLESLLSQETIENIRKQLGTTKKPTKKEIGLYFAEIVATSSNNTTFCNATKSNFEKILKFAETSLLKPPAKKK